jgi:hypothetical protein
VLHVIQFGLKLAFLRVLDRQLCLHVEAALLLLRDHFAQCMLLFPQYPPQHCDFALAIFGACLGHLY